MVMICAGDPIPLTVYSTLETICDGPAGLRGQGVVSFTGPDMLGLAELANASLVGCARPIAGRFSFEDAGRGSSFEFHQVAIVRDNKITASAPRPSSAYSAVPDDDFYRDILSMTDTIDDSISHVYIRHTHPDSANLDPNVDCNVGPSVDDLIVLTNFQRNMGQDGPTVTSQIFLPEAGGYLEITPKPAFLSEVPMEMARPDGGDILDAMNRFVDAGESPFEFNFIARDGSTRPATEINIPLTDRREFMSPQLRGHFTYTNVAPDSVSGNLYGNNLLHYVQA